MAILLLGAIPDAWGQSAAKPAASETATAPAAQQQDELVVVADPSQRSSIDRTTYAVRDTAEARSESMLDLLERIPSVDVTASGQIRMYGRSGVKILIDGNEVANPQVVLRNLQGSQIVKIEVVSNPSAQFSAQGTGGIINIILRRSFASGLAGSLVGSGGSFGGYSAKASPTWSHGRMSLSASIGTSHGATPSDFETQRAALDPGGAIIAQTIERGSKRAAAQNFTGSLAATYRPSGNQSMSLTANAVHVDGESTSRSDFTEFPDTGDRLSQTSSGMLNLHAQDIAFDYRRSFAKAGETLSFSAKQSDSGTHSATHYATLSSLGGPSALDLRSQSETGVTSVRLDYALPFAPKRRLALGMAIQHQRDRLVSLTAGQSPLGTGAFADSSTIDGSWTQGAAYTTYQFPWAGTTILAGLRIESRRYDLRGQPAGSALHQTNIFPSLHAERAVASWLTEDLSYSRRIEWPSIAELDPALRFTDSTTARTGDPTLLPQITDSFEWKQSARVARHDIQLTAFWRRTGGYQSNATVLSGGVLVLRPVSLGAQVSRGVSLDVHGPIARGVSYAVTGNLSDERVDAAGALADLVHVSARYDVTAQIEYRDGAEGKRNADHVELRVRHSGPTDIGLAGISAFTTANAIWSHGITDRLSSVLNVADAIGAPTIRTRYFSDGFISHQFERAAGPRVTLSLTLSLKRPAEH